MEEDYEIILEGFIDKIHTDFGLKLDIENIFWRGFCSQGDGLCFDFKLGDKEAFEFLLKLKCENIEHLKDAVNISDVGIEIETVKNNFATHYCHSNTRDINVDIYIKNDADIKNKSLFDLLSNPESFKNLQDEIKRWYMDQCGEMYNELEKHYNEVQDLDLQIISTETVEESNIDNSVIDKLKIRTFINLIKIDGKIDDREIELLENLMDKFELDSNDKIELISEINSKNKINIDYSILKGNSQEILYLLIDLVAIAKADGEVHITEKLFIKEVAKSLDFDLNDLNLLFES
mgnify:CR=1 FL=1